MNPANKTLSLTKWLIFPVCFLIILATTLTLHVAYKINRMAFNQMNVILDESNLEATPDTQEPWIKPLNQLSMAVGIPIPYKNTLQFLGFNQANTLQEQLDNRYQLLVTQYLIPYIKETVVNEVKNNADPINQFEALKVYMMLTDLNHRSNQTISNWFNASWQQHFPNQNILVDNLTQQLNNLLRNKTALFSIDQTLLNNACQNLQQEKLSHIAMALLAKPYINMQGSIFSIDPNLLVHFNINEANTNALYSSDNFPIIYNIRIPKLVKRLEKTSWLIKQIFPNNKPDNLIPILQNLYVQNYLSAQTRAIESITLKPATQLNDIKDIITTLDNPKATIWSLINQTIQTIKNNVANKCSQCDLSLLNSLSQFKSSAFSQPLTKLSVSLNTITSAVSEINASYTLASSIMKNQDPNDEFNSLIKLANQQPEPIKDWITQLTNGAWKIILDDAKAYLNVLWQTSVLPAYDSTIQNGFPIFQNAKQDITLQSFNQFFGPGGTMQQFYLDFLASFIDTSKPYWTWKVVDGQSISISQDDLDMIIRASIIQKMFYLDNPSEISLKFTLEPIKLNANISRFTLQIGTQKMVVTPTSKESKTLSWPDPNSHRASIDFLTLNPKQPNLVIHGPWSWLHLLNQAATIMPTSNARVFNLTFALNDQTAIFQLIADNPANPYLKNILTAFRCPNSL